MAGYIHPVQFDLQTCQGEPRSTLTLYFHYLCSTELEILQYLRTSYRYRGEIIYYAQELHEECREDVFVYNEHFTTPLVLAFEDCADEPFRQQILDRINVIIPPVQPRRRIR